MLQEELDRIKYYAGKLNESGGKLDRLGDDERKHLKMLIQKYELESKLSELQEELGQIPLWSDADFDAVRVSAIDPKGPEAWRLGSICEQCSHSCYDPATKPEDVAVVPDGKSKKVTTCASFSANGKKPEAVKSKTKAVKQL